MKTLRKMMSKTLGELLREKLDNPVNICCEEQLTGGTFEMPIGIYNAKKKAMELSYGKFGIDESQNKRKQVNILVKGKEMIQYQSRILVSINGSNNLVLEADTNLLNILSNASVAKVDRDWDGNVKSVKYTNDKPTITIVNVGEIEAPKPDPTDKIKALEQLQEKLKAEQDAITKQIDALSKD
jgi:hypothetical protein